MQQQHLLTAYIEILQRIGEDFKVRRKGSIVTVINSTEKRFILSPLMKGVHLCKLLRKDIADYKPERDYSQWHKVPIVYYIPDNVKKSIGETIVAIDINRCYWVTAYIIGVISEKTFKKGFEKGNSYKFACNAAIGGLYAMEIEDTYVKGVLQSDKTKLTRDENYRIRFDILEYVWYCFGSIMHELYDDVLFFMTDCLYVKKEAENKVIQLLNGFGYNCKVFHSQLISIEDIHGHDKVTWQKFHEPDRSYYNFSIEHIFTKNTIV